MRSHFNITRIEKFLPNLDDGDLLSLRVLIENQMAARSISIDVGGIGEKLAIEYFNSTSGLSNLIKAPGVRKMWMHYREMVSDIQ